MDLGLRFDIKNLIGQMELVGGQLAIKGMLDTNLSENMDKLANDLTDILAKDYE